MTGDEVLARLRTVRTAFDRRVEAIPPERLSHPPEGHTHPPKDVVAHVSAYEALIVERLRAARRSERTALDRDRAGWEQFNDRIWAEAEGRSAEEILASSAETFRELLAQVASLTDAELNESVGVTAWIDPGWLQGRTLWQVIGVDGFEHYPKHFSALEAAARDS